MDLLRHVDTRQCNEIVYSQIFLLTNDVYFKGTTLHGVRFLHFWCCFWCRRQPHTQFYLKPLQSSEADTGAHPWGICRQAGVLFAHFKQETSLCCKSEFDGCGGSIKVYLIAAQISTDFTFAHKDELLKDYITAVTESLEDEDVLFKKPTGVHRLTQSQVVLGSSC